MVLLDILHWSTCGVTRHITLGSSCVATDTLHWGTSGVTTETLHWGSSGVLIDSTLGHYWCYYRHITLGY